MPVVSRGLMLLYGRDRKKEVDLSWLGPCGREGRWGEGLICRRVNIGESITNKTNEHGNFAFFRMESL